MLGLLVHLAHVTQRRQSHPPWRHRQVPHACAAEPCPGLAIQHRWTLSSLVLTHTQHLAQVGWQYLLGLSCPRQLLLPACLPQQCSTASYQSWDSWGTATPMPASIRAVNAPSHPPNPACVHSSLWLAHCRGLQTRLMGICGHSHLQLWPMAWLKVSSSLQENEAMPNLTPVLALFLLPEYSQTNAQTRGAKSACSSSRTYITCVAELHQDNFFQDHLLEM